MSRRVSTWCAALAALFVGAAVAVALPALAPGDAGLPPLTASFTAEDYAWHVSGSTIETATIAAGGTVAFGYPAGRSGHDVDFSGGPAPTSCTQTAGVQSGPVPPLPALPTAPGWSGSCRFDTPGTYAFHCDAHPLVMHGTITVIDPNAPPPTTTTSPAAPGGTDTGGSGQPTAPGGSSGGPGPAGARPAPLLRGVSVARSQRGWVLRGAVRLGRRGRVVVVALVSNRALATGRRPRHLRQIRVGSQSRSAQAAGVVRFALRLDAAARSALRHRDRLRVTLRIAIVPPAGRAVVKTLAVTVRPTASARGQRIG